MSKLIEIVKSDDESYAYGYFPNIKDMAFIYVKPGCKLPNIALEPVSVKEEYDLLKNHLKYTEKDLEDYYTHAIKDNGFEGYRLFKTKIYIASNRQKYEEIDNSDDLTLYVVLRNDLNLTTGEKAVYISELTRTIADEIFVKYGNQQEFTSFMDLDCNTVVVEASAKELFEDNYIPAKYANPDVTFTYIYEDSVRVSQGNFRLKEGQIVALGYFGIKRNLPKFLKKLKLYGEK